MHPLQRTRRNGYPRNRLDQVIRIPRLGIRLSFVFRILFVFRIQFVSHLIFDHCIFFVSRLLVGLHDKTLILCFISASLDPQGKACQEFSKRRPRRKRTRSIAGCFATRSVHSCCFTSHSGSIASSPLGSITPSGSKRSTVPSPTILSR